MIKVLKYRLYIAPINEPLHAIISSANRVPDGIVTDISMGHSTDIEMATGISLGIAAPPQATIQLVKKDSSRVTSRIFNWRFANVAVQFSTNGVDFSVAFAGFIETRSEDLNTVSFQCQGYMKLLEYYKHVTPLWTDKPVATFIPDIPVDQKPWSTTTSGVWGVYASNQDPTTLKGSFTGTVNTVFWLLGGRPVKYKDHYANKEPNVRFWFDCDHAPIVPKFTWLNQENINDDFLSLVTSAGGQINQMRDGTVRFENPHSFAPETSTTYTVNDSMFSSLSIDEESAVAYGKIVITFSPRFLGANKAVLDSPIGKYLPYNEEYTHEVEFQQPVDRLTNNTYYGSGITFAQSGGYFGIDEFIESTDFVKAVDYNGDTASVSLKVPRLSNLYFAKRVYRWTGDPATSTWGYEHDIKKTAGQYIKLVVKNRDPARSLYLSKISLFGIPVIAGDPQTIKEDIPLEYPELVNLGVIPSGFREVRFNDNPYVQSRDHAQRILDVVKYLHKRARPKVQINDLVYDASVSVGDIIKINSLAYNIINQKYKVIEVQVNKTGSYMNLGCIDVSDIKTREDFFIVGREYAIDAEKYLSW